MEATQFERRVQALEERVGRMLGTAEPDAVGEARHLAALEHALIEALQVRGDPDRGDPVLADASAWRDLAEQAGTPAGARAADEFVQQLIRAGAEAFRAEQKQAARGDDPDAWFQVLAEARTFDLEALSRRAMEPPLAPSLPDLRTGFLEALESHAPTLAQRRRWTTELVDRADVVLVGLDNVEPDRARKQIERVVDDLEWHVQQLESAASLRHTRLKRKITRLRSEGQERDLQLRMEQRYSAKDVARSERFILWLIVLVLGILAADGIFDFSEQTRLWLDIADLGACCAFLTEFFIRLAKVSDKPRWFLRHFLVDFLPSIPFAFALRWARALRLMRLLRAARFMRAFGFMTRGIDRIVRKYGSVLNRNIVLYPTREERLAMERQRQDVSRRLRRLHARINQRWTRLLATAPRPMRERVVRLRVEELAKARPRDHSHPPGHRDTIAPAQRDLAADDLLNDLAVLTPQALEAAMGQDFVARMARAVRLFSRPPLRWLPVLRRYVPRIGRGMSDAEIVVAGAHRAARELQHNHDRYFWFADLHGTVTPSQFVDRVGTTMVKSARRPAMRLLIFGAVFLLLQRVLSASDTGLLVDLHTWLHRVVGVFLQIVGTICFAILAVGWWLRRVAGQATEFFARSARAAYIGLTESIKGRHLDRDADTLDRRVFRPEQLVHGRVESDSDRDRFKASVRSWLLEAQPGSSLEPGFDPVERAVWIFRDSLDGALLGVNDTHTTGQLLGNPALRNLWMLAERVSRRDQRRLAKLDLERQKSFLGGPYLWFSLVCRAIEHGVARLLVEYNRHAIPVDQLPRAADADSRRYEAWLGAGETPDLASEKLLYVTNDFTALHFLDADDERDRQVGVRFGPRVLKRLQRDRRHLVRRVFGTYPLHKRPRDERVLNLYRIYLRWLAGGRALLIPLRVLWNWLRFCGRLVVWLARCVREVRRPRFSVDVATAEGADFETALRKIRRMRGPVAEAALRIRARFDPEYLGLRLPGTVRSGLEGIDVDRDLRFLGCDADLVHEIDVERRRASEDMLRLSRLLAGGLWERIGPALGMGSQDFGREHLRAAAAAYVADMRKVRRYLSAPELLESVYERAARESPMPFPLWPRPLLRAAFRRYWRAHGAPDREAKRAAWRATVHNVEGIRDTLLAWREAGDGARERGERILVELLRYPERITEQLVTLRIVQTLSLIDVLNYREHIYRLGDYAASGDDPRGALGLGPA